MKPALLLLLVTAAHGQITLKGVTSGAIVNYYQAHPDLHGDTNFCTLTAATYANGTSAGTSTLNLNDGVGNQTLNGRLLCTFNDGVTVGGSARSIGVYAITVLDMSSAANTTFVDVNAMTSYGNNPDTPTGWNGEGTSGQGSGYTWKSGPWISFGGWSCLPILRQSGPGYFAGSDSSIICTPNGGAHFMNPFNYRRNTISNVACAANVVTLTTNTNALTVGGGDVLWIHGANTGANGQFTSTAATATSVSYAATCAGVTTGASSGYVGLMSATGDAPLPPADASYTATPSSMMWKDLTPYDGTTNRAGRLYFFDYCQNQACTGMPHGADSYLHGFMSNGRQLSTINFRVPKNIDSVMDSTAYEFYVCSNYSPANVCDGTSATYRTTTLANATMLFSGDGGIANGSGVSINLSPHGYTDMHGQMFGNPVYYCANGGCAYVTLTHKDYLSDPTFAISAITKANPAVVTSDPHGYSVGQTFPVHISGATGTGWVTGINVYATAIALSATTFSVPVDSTGFGTLGGTVIWSGQRNKSNIMAYTSPWGPFAPTTSEFTNEIPGFWTVLSFTASTPDSVPYHKKFVGIGDSYSAPFETTSSSVGFQAYEFSLGVNQNGSILAGCTPYRFAWSPVSGAIIRRGLYAFFDFYSHGCGDTRYGNLYYTSIFANDITTYPPQKQMVGCFTDGGDKCANPNAQHDLTYSRGGVAVLNNGYQPRFELTDTMPGVYNRITSHPFATSADPAFTTSFIIKPSSIATATQAIMQTGTSDHLMVVLVSFGATGKIGIDWDSGGSFVVANTSNAVLTDGTWYYVTFTKSAGAVTVCATVPCSATVHGFINGVEVPLTRTNTGTPDMVASKLTFGGGTASFNSFSGLLGGLEMYNRVLSPAEILHNYKVHQSRLLISRAISFVAAGTLSWTALTNGQWTALTNGQWTAMTN